MSKSVNVDFVTRQIEVDTDGKEYYVSAAVAAKDAEQSMINAQNAATSVKKYKALWFDSVASMKAEPSLTVGAYVNTAGYYESNDGGGASYLIRAKADSDIADGGSVHELANGLVAELIIEHGTVNVKQFGAKGDWISDDSNVLQIAISVASTQRKVLYFPVGAYFVTNEIEIDVPISVIMDGSIVYNGDGTALTIGKSDEQINGNYKLSVKRTSSTYSTNSIGILLKNHHVSSIKIDKCDGFANGVKFVGDSKGFASNSVWLGDITNFITAITLDAINMGYVNNNSFFGGKAKTNTKFPYLNDAVSVLITSSDNSYKNNNNNIFYGINCEDTPTAISIEHGILNYFYNIRTENVSHALKTYNNAEKNYILVGYGETTYTAKGKGNNFITTTEKNLSNSSFKGAFDSGFLPTKCVSNDTTIRGGGIVENIGCEKHNNYIAIPQSRYIAFVLNVKDVEKIRLSYIGVNDEDTTGLRWQINMFDASGNSVDEQLYENALNSPMMRTDNYLGLGYRSPTNKKSGEYSIVSLPSQCVKIKLILWSESSSLKVTRFCVDGYSAGPCLADGSEIARLNAIPTCEGEVGDICYNSDFNGNNTKYWIYSSAGAWMAV